MPTRPRLERSSSDRYVGGVCGGLGRYFDIDPVVFRVGIACMAFFGAGVVVYAAAWALIPEEGDEHSIAQNARHGGGRDLLVIAAVLIAGLVTLDAIFDGGGGIGDGEWLLPLLLIGGFLWWRRDGGHARRGITHYPPPVPPAWPTAAPPPTAADVPPGASTFWAATATTAPLSPMSPPAASWAGLPQPPKAPRERSQLGVLTFSALLLAVGVVALLDTAEVIDLSLQAVLAVALLVVGAGLVVGALFGRSRGLIALGLLLSLAVSVVAAVDIPLRGTTGDITWRVTSTDQLDDGYHLRAGSARLDLTAVEFAEQTRTLEANVGFGELIVLVPEGVTVRVTGHLGAGEADIFGVRQDGFDVDIDTTESPTPQLVINTRIGFGSLEVRHVAS